jgi:hypothetical protein
LLQIVEEIPAFEELQDRGRFATRKNQAIEIGQLLTFPYFNWNGARLRQCFGMSRVISLYRQDANSRSPSSR